MRPSVSNDFITVPSAPRYPEVCTEGDHKQLAEGVEGVSSSGGGLMCEAVVWLT